MNCSKDCGCTLCRELQNFKVDVHNSAIPTSPLGRIFNDNFILRRNCNTSSIKSFQQIKSDWFQCQSQPFVIRSTATPSPTPIDELPQPLNKLNHKVVIYFGNSIATTSSMNKTKYIKETKINETNQKENRGITPPITDMCQKIQVSCNGSSNVKKHDYRSSNRIKFNGNNNDKTQNDIFNIRSEDNYQTVSTVCGSITDIINPVAHNKTINQSDNFDWSFIQEWRARPTGSVPVFSTGQLQSMGLSYCSHNQTFATTEVHTVPSVASLHRKFNNSSTTISSLSDTKFGDLRSSENAVKDTMPHVKISPTHLTAQNTPIQLVSPMVTSLRKTIVEPVLSYSHNPTSRKLENDETHDHKFRAVRRVNDCQSSSDENRSSGHASMSDNGGNGSSSPGCVMLGPLPEDRLAAGVTNRSTRSRTNSNYFRPRYRVASAKSPWNGSGLDEVRLAMQQLTMRSQTSTSTYSSLSAGSESSEPARRLGRFSSLETVNTNITNADEFVWVDSYNRLVELQNPPWSQSCIMRVIQNGRFKEHASNIALDILPRLAYLLQRALVRVAREIQRLSVGLGLCSKQEVAAALKIILSPNIADSCIKACLRAAAMFAVSGESALKQTKSARAGLQLSVGRFFRWMIDAQLGKFIHEYAAVYLCAGIENLLEKILLQSFPAENSNELITVTIIESNIAESSELWGLLQPFEHLGAGRIASGVLTMPQTIPKPSTLGINMNKSNSLKSNLNIDTCLLTTCVGSIMELKELAIRTQKKCQYSTALSNSAFSALFYFMRCSQLEHSQTKRKNHVNIQELGYERAYVVLPPLIEWLRVSSAHAQYRNASIIDMDDIMQAARLLLPGVDCPVRPICVQDDELSLKKSYFQGSGTITPLAPGVNEDITEIGVRATINLAFKLMLTGRAELFSQASNLLPPNTRYDTLNNAGMSALMIACIQNDETAIKALLDAGCDPNVEVPGTTNVNCSAIHPDVHYWTAVTFAASRANYTALRILLERGGRVEGGAKINNETTTLTPLQLACGTGNLEIITLLLSHGANAFLSTKSKDSICFAGNAQKGCFCAISVAAAHGHWACVRKLLSHPVSPGIREVLSFEEMLAEADTGNGRNVFNDRSKSTTDQFPKFNKAQIRSLQEAMYHSIENNHLEITIELRKLGVPWTLHCWMHALSVAHDLQLSLASNNEHLIDELLQDFIQVCPDYNEYSVQFVTECLPLLFNIFETYSKNESTTLLLADIFATCFGREIAKKEPIEKPKNYSVINPKFVNNPELSDVTFRVEGKTFYGHKIVLVNASPRFQNMLNYKPNETNDYPTIQINDIRYHVFQMVMQFLYSGGSIALELSNSDVLELMAAASFFQLDSLLKYTEERCSEIVDIENVVAMYIHAKIYNAHNLLQYCQCFLLQNMVALLTYDDSVKRLLFAKKIPNHDVLSELLQILQQHIKSRSFKI